MRKQFLTPDVAVRAMIFSALAFVWVPFLKLQGGEEGKEGGDINSVGHLTTQDNCFNTDAG